MRSITSFVAVTVLLWGSAVVPAAAGTKEAKTPHISSERKARITQHEEMIKQHRMERKERRRKEFQDRIDLNNDGTIDPKERSISWKRSKAKVSSPWEKQYDANGDGWMQPDEVRAMLAGKQAMITTNGQAKVDSTLEMAYDANGDGVIDAREAKALKADLDE